MFFQLFKFIRNNVISILLVDPHNDMKRIKVPRIKIERGKTRWRQAHIANSGYWQQDTNMYINTSYRMDNTRTKKKCIYEKKIEPKFYIYIL